MGAGVEFLLDEGSEINIMNIDVFNALNSLNRVKIDENIKWSMRDANQGFSELKGVCKDCLISINGIEVSVPVFVSNNTEPQVILGRPWERNSRAMKDNREDGTLWYTIKDSETGASTTFCAVGKEDNRAFPKNYKKGSFTLVNRIEAGWNAITKTEYVTEVRAQYKKIGEKIKPVPHTLPKYSTGTNHKTNVPITDEKLIEERINSLKIGNGNLLNTEIEYFKKCLKPLNDVLAFSDDEVGLLKEEFEPPIKAYTVPHIPWSHKPYPSPKGLWDQIKSLIKKKMDQGIL
ncbi:hypothetical protein AYI69_g7447 [Smittium culicis]|uniref:Uncharacterized protein n=1 Tax=Smittium culicis TaxID=133412 RepID=A0A1R1XS00_9FUNG|nr:hypothetical protein AYI69_g7447 [Smittium culicis]